MDSDCQFFYCPLAGKHNSHYHYIYVVDFPIIIELVQLFKVYSYHL